jgi:Zn-dependent protease with chaperone function
LSHLILLSSQVASALIAAVWQGAILAICVALLLRLLPGLSAAVRSAIWLAVFALATALHFVPARAASVPADGGHALQFAAGWSVVFAAVWLALSLLRAVQFGLGALRLRQVFRRATPIASDFQRLAPSGSRRYLLCSSPDVDRPSVLGFFHPRILLPPGLIDRLSVDELRQVLLHETEHLRRADDWTNLLQKLALVIFPLNPVLYWVERRLCLERELACDDRVLNATGARKAYATCLTQLAEHSILQRGLTLALGALGQRAESQLAQRVHRILRQPEPVMSAARSRFATATLLLAVVGATATLARAPRLVSFGSKGQVASAETLPTTAQGFSGENWGRPVLAKAMMPEPRAIAAVARMPVRQRSAVRHAVKARVAHPNATRVMTTGWRELERQSEPRLTVMFTTSTISATQQVQPMFVPAVAYAAVRTPDGWIVFQL